ncbi:MAG: hypothetical protein RDV41_00760 [Planctomycetota bacterium]|nr:hypothetical protein [Planctomycetota bacterium]
MTTPRAAAWCPAIVLALVALAVCQIGGGGIGCSAQETAEGVQLGTAFPAPEKANGEIADIVVFKNQYAFVRRYYSLKEGNVLRIGEVPNAVFGTFFALADPDKAEVTSVAAEFVEAQREVDCTDIEDIMLANVGKQMKLFLSSGPNPTVVGTLQKVLVQGAEEEPGSTGKTTDREETITYSTWYPYWWDYPWWGPHWSSRSMTSTVVSQPPTSRAPAAVHYAVQTDEGLLIVESTDISSVMVLDEKPELSFKMKGKAKQLSISVRRKAEGPVVIAMVYLVKGMNWFPSYRLDLSGEETAELVMHGVIENDLGPLHGAHVRLAAGVPHFFRQECLSPLTLESIVESGANRASSIQQQVFYGARGDWASNAAQVAGDYQPIERPAGAGQPEADTAFAGANEDLFLYDCGKLELAAGARAKLLLHQAKIKYRDIYTWEYNFDRAAAELYRKHSGNQLPANEEEARRVWHSLVLENNTGFPWSTGVASVFKNGQIIAQERLTYTPSGSQNELKLTVATDIMNRTSEEELARKQNVRLEDGCDYVRVSDKFSMELTNLKREAVTVRVKRWVHGTVEKAEDAKVSLASRGEYPSWWNWNYGYNYYGWWSRFNPLTVVEWEVKLEPGKNRTLTLERFYFFR